MQGAVAIAQRVLPPTSGHFPTQGCSIVHIARCAFQKSEEKTVQVLVPINLSKQLESHEPKMIWCSQSWLSTKNCPQVWLYLFACNQDSPDSARPWSQPSHYIRNVHVPKLRYMFPTTRFNKIRESPPAAHSTAHVMVPVLFLYLQHRSTKSSHLTPCPTFQRWAADASESVDPWH